STCWLRAVELRSAITASSMRCSSAVSRFRSATLDLLSLRLDLLTRGFGHVSGPGVLATEDADDGGQRRLRGDLQRAAADRVVLLDAKVDRVDHLHDDAPALDGLADERGPAEALAEGRGLSHWSAVPLSSAHPA